MLTSEEFKSKVWEMADKIGVEPTEIHLRRMKNKWASCSVKGRLTFDKSLLKEDDEMQLNVIIHELLHFKYPNHGRMFKNLLKSHLKSIS
jgi:predicted metal-dependent hydrolase